ncbi:MAG: 4'-phosphopantetheinyl transferase superfamily protein [Desulfobulbaceae bacterium]|nr:4'-phosphopantetheinyl transferase superfamily protein [Desulfobulbaceae bacterium]
MLTDLTGPVEESFGSAEDFPVQVKIVTVNLLDLQEKLESMPLLQGGNHFLCRKEREKLLEFRYPKRKIEWLGGRIAAKYAGLMHCDAKRINKEDWQSLNWHEKEIVADERGKPFFYGAAEEIKNAPQISISHSKGIAVGLAARTKCGVDIQQITSALERIQTRFITEEEREKVEEMSQSLGVQNALSLLWSAKEAVKKAQSCDVLPGFMDITLCGWEKQGQGRRFRIITQKNGISMGEQTVWAGFIDGYSFAMTVLEG